MAKNMAGPAEQGTTLQHWPLFQGVLKLRAGGMRPSARDFHIESFLFAAYLKCEDPLLLIRYSTINEQSCFPAVRVLRLLSETD